MQRSLLSITLAAIACTSAPKPVDPHTTHDSLPVANTPQPAKQSPRPIKVLFFGTSLTAGLGLQEGQAFPALVEQMADSAGTPITATNAGLSGETTAGALRRISWVLRTPSDVVVIEAGANDGLRGLPVADAKANIEGVIDRIKNTQPAGHIVLIQMEAPPNLGAGYGQAFHDMYGDIAKTKRVTLIPFMLTNVYGRSQLNQDDGVHPNAAGEQIVAKNVWHGLQPVIQSMSVRVQ